MSGSTYTEEVLDLRELILILWRRKWLILGISIISGLLGFLISSFLVPEKYQADSIVTITDRSTWLSLEVKSLPLLAESDELKELTFELLGITDLEGEQNYILSADADARGQVNLQVTALDPDLAAEAANIWANVLSERIKVMYGTSQESLATLEEQITPAWARYTAAQKDLEDFYGESSLETYSAQLSAAQSALGNILMEIERNRLILSDIQTLAEQIGSLDQNAALEVGVALSLINLQGRLTAVQDSPPRLDPIPQTALNLEEAEIILLGLRNALENQNLQLEGEATILENEIYRLSSSLEVERNQEQILRLDRDLAQGTYAGLLADLEESQNNLDQEEFYIQISAKAVAPNSPSSPNVLMNSGFAGVSAALLMMLGTLCYDWWVKQELSASNRT